MRIAVVIVSMLLSTGSVAAETVAFECSTSAGKIEKGARGELVWIPGTREDLVRCDGHGYEPLDRYSAEVGDQRQSIEPLIARDIELHVEPAAHSLEVEWLSPRKTDLLRPVAKRHLSPEGDVLKIAVAESDIRVLRVRWPDGRIWMTLVDDETAYAAEGTRGGSAFLYLGSRNVIPQQIIATSSSGRSRAPISEEGFGYLTGLGDGRHHFEVEFDSGLRTAVSTENIIKSDSIQISPRLVPYMGGIRLEVEGESCAERQVALIVRVRSVASEVPVVSRTLPPEDCQLLLTGLPPGSYEVSWREGEQSDPTEQSEFVRADEIVEFILNLEPAILHGKVTYGKRPASAVLVSLISVGPESEASTDEEGRFSIQAPAPGRYDLLVRGTQYAPGFRKTIDLRRGYQMIDLELPSGRLAVTVKFESSAESIPAQVVIQGEEGRRTGIAAPPSLRAEFLALEPGEYEITASAPPDWILPRPVRVTIDAIRTSEELEVKLERGESRLLRLFDRTGVPIANAHVQLDATIVSASEPGIYHLPPSGSRLYVKSPRHVPICRNLGHYETTSTLILSEGLFPLVVRSSTDPSSIAIEGLPSSTCRISVLDFETTIERVNGFYTMTIGGLPSGSFVFHHGSQSVPVTVPASEITNLN